MAQIIFAVTVPDESFDPVYYPLENPSVKDMIEFDIKAVNDNIVSEVEYLDGLLERGQVTITAVTLERGQVTITAVTDE